jgi:hypothetical protein
MASYPWVFMSRFVRVRHFQGSIWLEDCAELGS